MYCIHSWIFAHNRERLSAVVCVSLAHRMLLLSICLWMYFKKFRSYLLQAGLMQQQGITITTARRHQIGILCILGVYSKWTTYDYAFWKGRSGLGDRWDGKERDRNREEQIITRNIGQMQSSSLNKSGFMRFRCFRCTWIASKMDRKFQ